MNCILLDISALGTQSNLYKFLPGGNPSSHTGVIMEVSDPAMVAKLTSTAKPDRRAFINSPLFINGCVVLSYANISLKDNTVVFVDFDSRRLTSILSTAIEYLPNTMTNTISTSTGNTTDIKRITQAGFTHPVTDNNGTVSFSRRNDLIPRHDIKQVFDKTQETIQVHDNKEGVKRLSISLSPVAADYLKNISYRRRTANRNGTVSQKEVGGVFSIERISAKSHYTLSINPDTFVHGDEEEIRIPSSYFSFHTHPHEAYVANNVDKGWPSVCDYLSFMESTVVSNGIAHVVIAREGYYILSRGKNSLGSRDPYNLAMREFIRTNYVYDKHKHSVADYIKQINKLEFNNTSLITVQFAKWGQSRKKYYIFYKNIIKQS